ncbi:ATP phosphoribosyltransferase [Desulfolutivibrio sulfoxidireducens]|uniref:ATP phosphoribosyltransferase n=1 Tax=Desulfolutivibrio sulfoxidireducens TaxID=2773299 RepID=UPI00159E6A20|nr:ATP phosphoribosyltransferase [Desulfolutivibrio sulfoxidireducens]QLA14709.1 ATP phosphoribosyltransferase [Desulfolutivibrio sulfoxidireducens]QLA18291.1 ATP phosphoribosyltransferase [Desulfolutivibrio sulfoxidireducens]
MNPQKKLKLGIPKGSLQDATIALFEKSGWKIRMHHRNYFPEINDPDIQCSMCRAQEMSRYVETGTLDAGLTGKDWILENNSDVVVVSDLVYSKVSNRPARWVLAVAADSPYRRPQDLAGKKIATELVSFTKSYFESADVPVSVEFSWGATEAKVVEGLADAIVEVTETGTTIKAHGLRIIAELLQTNTRLIANKTAWEDPFKRKKIENLNLLLQGALRAESLVGLKMNVPEDKMPAIMGLLPSLTAPTVANLYNKDWLSVEIVVSESLVRDLIPQLRELGAEGIIEYSLNKVI